MRNRLHSFYTRPKRRSGRRTSENDQRLIIVNLFEESGFLSIESIEMNIDGALTFVDKTLGDFIVLD